MPLVLLFTLMHCVAGADDHIVNFNGEIARTGSWMPDKECTRSPVLLQASTAMTSLRTDIPSSQTLSSYPKHPSGSYAKHFAVEKSTGWCCRSNGIPRIFSNGGNFPVRGGVDECMAACYRRSECLFFDYVPMPEEKTLSFMYGLSSDPVCRLCLDCDDEFNDMAAYKNTTAYKKIQPPTAAPTAASTAAPTAVPTKSPPTGCASLHSAVGCRNANHGDLLVAGKQSCQRISGTECKRLQQGGIARVWGYDDSNGKGCTKSWEDCCALDVLAYLRPKFKGFSTPRCDGNALKR